MSSQIPKDDFPDEMYLPPEVSSLGDIIPMRVKRLVKAKPGDTIRCQWVGCHGEFRATAVAIRHHFDREHLKEYREKKEESREIEKEEEAVNIEEGEEEETLKEEKAEGKAEKSSQAIGVECLWLVNGRVPCKNLRRPGREDKAPKPYMIIAFEKHIGTHLYKEGLPSPYTKECKCCGHLYIGRGSGKSHEMECKEFEDARKRVKLSHGEEEEEQDSDAVFLTSLGT